jgi:hypothetical protein
VKALVNAFLNHKKALRDAGELSPRTWGEYKDTCDLLVSALGKQRVVADVGPDGRAALRKKMAKRWGPVRLGNTSQRVRSVFKYAPDAGLIDRAVCFGPGFERPSVKVLRLHRAAQGPKLFTAEEVRALIGAAGQPLKAMLLLGINDDYLDRDSLLSLGIDEAGADALPASSPRRGHGGRPGVEAAHRPVLLAALQQGRGPA